MIEQQPPTDIAVDTTHIYQTWS